jgi:hypothetical protein
MIVVKYKKEIQVMGAGEPVKTDESHSYYITSNPTSKKKRKEIVFTGTKEQCKKYVDNLPK